MTHLLGLGSGVAAEVRARHLERMEEISGELGRLAQFRELTRSQEAARDEMARGFDHLEGEVRRLDGGRVRVEAGSTSEPWRRDSAEAAAAGGLRDAARRALDGLRTSPTTGSTV